MTDYLLDTNSDLLITNGNPVKGDSTLQNQKLLLFAEPGEYKQYPTTGVGIMNYLKDDSPDALLRSIRLQFSQDGMTVNQLNYVQGQLKINAPYGQ